MLWRRSNGCYTGAENTFSTSVNLIFRFEFVNDKLSVCGVSFYLTFPDVWQSEGRSCTPFQNYYTVTSATLLQSVDLNKQKSAFKAKHNDIDYLSAYLIFCIRHAHDSVSVDLKFANSQNGKRFIFCPDYLLVNCFFA